MPDNVNELLNTVIYWNTIWKILISLWIFLILFFVVNFLLNKLDKIKEEKSDKKRLI